MEATRAGFRVGRQAIPRAKADRPGAAFNRLILPDTDMWPLEQLAEMIRDRPKPRLFGA